MTDSARRFLIFTMRGKQYAFDLAQVAEVSEPPVVWPIPTAPAYYHGAMNFHGVIVAVMNLPAFMGIEGCGQPEKLVVLDHRLASLGFLVDQVLRIVPESETTEMLVKDEGMSCGSFLVSNSRITLLDPARLAARATETINS